MKEEQLKFMNLHRLPARLTYIQVAWLLNISEADVALLVAAKLLTALGAPGINSVKYIALVQIEEISRDKDQLDRISHYLYKKRREKNKSDAKHSNESCRKKNSNKKRRFLLMQ